LSKSAEAEHEVSTRVSQSRSESGNGEGLTGGSAHENVNCSIITPFDRRKIAMKRRIGEAVLQYRAGEFVDLGHEGALEAQRFPCDGYRFDAGAD
jgi:hypothetical protein